MFIEGMLQAGLESVEKLSTDLVRPVEIVSETSEKQLSFSNGWPIKNEPLSIFAIFSVAIDC
jgi:hypothetical protein